MRKFFTLVAIFASVVAFVACSSKQQPSKSNMVGTWKHPLVASVVSVNDGDPISIVNNEIITLKEDGTFVMGEYGPSSTVYEVTGTWNLSDDKTLLEFTFEDGETNSIDIREFTGDSFVTTSIQGNDFKFTKE